MKFEAVINEEHSKLLLNFTRREQQENTAAASLTKETLKALNVSVDALPHKCQQLLRELAEEQSAVDVNQLDTITVAYRQSQQIAELLEEEFEVLELKQKNQELQKRIDVNKRIIEGLKRELESSKGSLAKQTPSPENILEHIRQTKQKLTSYEDIYEKAKLKFATLNIPESVMPKPLQEMALRLAALKEEESSLRQRADDVTLARKARETLNLLRR